MSDTTRLAGGWAVRAYWYGRFSTARQELGSSRLRQSRMASEWCKRKGIPLDETLSYFDGGLNSFRGANRKRGGLGLFLKDCEEGRVMPGAYLLTESLDRLSREQLQEGQQLIYKLLFTYKIKLIVLGFAGGMELTAENYEHTHHVINAEFVRAHGESKRKSELSTWNWDDRRKQLDEKGKPITLKIPEWLTVRDGKPARDDVKAAVVQQIFEWSASGWGFTRIAARLNREGVPVFGRGKCWRNCTVANILASRATLGEFQAHRLKGAERVPYGPVRQGYFPAVVTAELFLSAKTEIEGRRKRRGGKTAPRVPNLFTRLVYEHDLTQPNGAGDVVSYAEKFGVGYLRTARRDTPGVRYDAFERSLLYWLREVNVKLNNSADVSALRERRDALDAQIAEMDTAIRARPKQLARFLGQVAEMQADRDRLTAEMEAATVPMQSHLMHGKRLAVALAGATGEEREALRLGLRQCLQTIIERIDLTYYDGEEHHSRHHVILIRFKDGTVRKVEYRTLEGRVIWGACGIPNRHGGVFSDGKSKDEHKQEMGEFPTDPDPLDEVKSKCKAMRAAGKSYPEITEATGLKRLTAWRYVNDYVRPEQKAYRAKRLATVR